MLSFNELSNFKKGSIFYENIEGICMEIIVTSDIVFIPEDRDLITEYIMFRGMDENGIILNYRVYNGLFGYYGLYDKRRKSRPVDNSYINVKNPAIL
jgi:hypothetical protein